MKILKSNITLLFCILLSFEFIIGCKKEEKKPVEETKFFSPSGLKATAYSDSTIRVSWIDNSNVEVGFQLQRKVGTGAYQLIKEVAANDTVYIDTDVAPNLVYTYRVRAESKSEETSFSDEATVKLDLPVPVLNASAIDDTDIKLSWTEHSALASGFVLERSINGQSFAAIAEPAKNITSYTDNTVQINTEYRYRIKAKNKLTETDYSNIVTTKIKFIPPALSCTFPGGNSVTLAWTDSSQFEKGFIVEQSINGGTFTQLTKVDSSVLSYPVKNLSVSNNYAFRVKAYSAKNATNYSNQKNIHYNKTRYVISETYQAQRGAADAQVALSPSGKLVASTSYYSNNVVIANRVTHSTSILTTNHPNGTFAIRFSKDNHYLVISSAEDGNIEIWNVNTGARYRKVGTGMEALFAMAFNDAGNLLAVAGTGTSKILVFNFPAMTLQYTLATDNSNVRGLLFDQNDTRLISCGNNDKIRFWNLGTLQLEKTLSGTPGHVGTIDLNTDGTLLTSSSYDATTNQLKIWSTTTGDLLRAISIGAGVSRTFFGADNNIYCTDYNGNVQVIDQSGNILNKIPIGSLILYADFNKTLKILTTFSADGNINVLTSAPVWQEYQ